MGEVVHTLREAYTIPLNEAGFSGSGAGGVKGAVAREARRLPAGRKAARVFFRNKGSAGCSNGHG